MSEDQKAWSLEERSNRRIMSLNPGIFLNVNLLFILYYLHFFNNINLQDADTKNVILENSVNDFHLRKSIHSNILSSSRESRQLEPVSDLSSYQLQYV